MKKWILIGVGVFLLVIVCLAAVFLPMVARMKQAALKVAAESEAREKQFAEEMEMEFGSSESSEDVGTIEVPLAEAAPEGISGTYEREDESMRFKLVLENSGTFKSYFGIHQDPGKTFDEQASGNWKLVDEEVHFSYQTPANSAKRGLIHIFSVQEDGSLVQIAGIANGERHELSKEQQAETLDWMKK